MKKRSTLIFKNLVLILLFIQVLSCKKDEKIESKAIRVNFFQQTTVGVVGGPYLTLSTQEGKMIGTSSWDTFSYNIEGFNYEPGYIYDLNITSYEVKNPPEDGSRIAYKLDKIISKTKAPIDATFNLDLKAYNYLFVSGSANIGFKVLNRLNIDCGTLCKDLELAISSGTEKLTGKFSLNSDGSLKLISIK
ncbi:DUF4377 domain-containing protein [Pedobacter nototheniae]|uniref:DUF4377 domain-containing protein n=1 Tax=Pedobacter nototheniae TaxID=2488994 RepID=UPI00103C614F|nr:DUF4377 domain-containing protein [Pedobacter nototheniae]